MASQSGTSSGPFTVTVSNLPFGWGGLISISVQRLTCPRQRPFGPATGLVSGQLSPAVDGGSTMSPQVSCRLDHRHSLVGHPAPAEERSLTVGLPSSQRLDPTGSHVPHIRVTAGLGAPYPEAQRCSHDRSDPSGRRSPPSTRGQALSPRSSSHLQSCPLRGVIKGSLAFTRPAFPSPGDPWMDQGPWALPRASHPNRQDLRRTPGRGTDIEHSPGLHDRHRRTSYP